MCVFNRVLITPLRYNLKTFFMMIHGSVLSGLKNKKVILEMVRFKDRTETE